MARRLPVYLLIDTSGSMHGEPIEAVRNGIQLLQNTLNEDPYALETAWISVITFDTEARQVTPLTEVCAFQAPKIEASGITEMGKALTLLAERIEAEVKKNTPERKGDFKPLVFIMTDGAPTDEIDQGIERLKHVKLGTVVGCAVGASANQDVLKKITDNVVALDHADSSTIKQFFKWVSASVSVSSKQIDRMPDDKSKIEDLPPPPPSISIV